MALQGTISGINQIYFGGQTALTAIFTDTETGQTPAGLQYDWRASDGSFIGATDGPSATYRADTAQNTDQDVTITCEVTLPGNPTPTVSAPSLTAMTELGITGQLVNMLIDVQINDAELFNDTNTGVLDAGFDAELTSTLIIRRIRWNDSNQLILNRSGGGSFRDYWTATQRQNYSAYIIIHDGTVLELPGDWIPTTIGNGYVRWEVPSTETTIINVLDAIATGHQILLGIADADSIGIPDETASADATVNVQYNAPPNVTITAPQKVNPGDSVPISVSAVDPEGRAVTVLWSATGGTIDNPTSLTPNFTAPPTSGPVTLTCYGTDADGVEGSSTHVIVINSPPTVVITAPSQLEVERTGNISIAVSDPNNDAVTVLLETSAGSIDNPTALSAILTAPATPQTITVTCTATDSEGLETVETAQITIVANQPPTLSITVPNALEVGQTGNLRATVGDPTNDPVTVLWEATAGAIGNPTALNATITVPVTPQTITVTCTATDDRGATTTQTATITVRQPNRPPTVSLNVPATASPGQTVNIEAVVDDLDGDDTEGEWRSLKGSIAQPDSKSTTFTAPLEAGIVPLTYEAMDDMGATTSKTAYITVGDPKANIYTPAYQIEIQGVDVTSRWIKRDGMAVGKSLDYPELLNFRSSGVQFNLDNADGAFDYSNPSNFFVSNSLPAHGRGAQVLVSLGRSESELAPVFAGEISAVVTSLRDTRARIKARDLSVVLRQKTIENFGLEITRRITDYAGANTDYDELNPVFYFPVWALPISRGSVSLTVEEDGSDVTINVVDVVGTTGVLSNRNAEVDYNRGLIRFEVAPTDGEDTIIDATWRQDYIYKRPDFLIRSLLENAGINTLIGITDATDARFAIEGALVRDDTDRVFSTHGRPYFEKEGITRWLKRDATNQKIYLAHDWNLVEYDERLDEYDAFTRVPADTSITESPPGSYGTPITDETVTLASTSLPYGPLAITPEYFVVPRRSGTFAQSTFHIELWDRAGEMLVEQALSVQRQLKGLEVYDGRIYTLWSYGTVLNPQDRVTITQISDRSLFSFAVPALDDGSYLTVSGGIAVTPTRIIILHYPDVHFFDHDFTHIPTEDFTHNISARRDIEATSEYIYIIDNNGDIHTFRHDGSAASDLDIAATDLKSLAIEGARLYGMNRASNSREILVYTIAESLTYESLVPIQFDTTDFDSFYCLCTNTLKGDAISDPTFNKNSVEKYVRSTDTWDTLLDSSKGQPQVAHPNDFVDHIEESADNRKHFEVIRRSSKTLIFYRRVTATQASISYYNETDDSCERM